MSEGPAPAELVANARMYAVTPAVEAAWRRVLERAGRAAGVPLAYRPHPAPRPLDTLWARPDLGLAFVCGWPFANRLADLQPVAAPVPAGEGAPRYRTDLVVRADAPPAAVPAWLAGRVGWTAEHSQSGFHALRRFTAAYTVGTWVGPLVTPRAVIDALLAGEIDVGPLDSLWHALLARHEPETAARLRVVARTEPTPPPLLAASPGVEPDTVRRLADVLASLPRDADLEALGLDGFAPVTREDYASLVSRASAPPSSS